jgi:hypothetical protein
MAEDSLQREEDGLANLQARVRDLYMLYRELRARHVLNADPEVKNRAYKPVFFAKPLSIFVKNPEIQKLFRESIVDKIGEIPHPSSMPFLSEKLYEEFEALSEREKPDVVRQLLADFFYEQAKNFIHKKVKLLLKWGILWPKIPHNDAFIESLRSVIFTIDREVDDFISRYERLRSPEDFPGRELRPSPRTEDGLAMFFEEQPISFSSIARDDIQSYIRIRTDELRQTRTIDKFLRRLKWIWVTHRWEIWYRSNEYLIDLKSRSIQRMKLMTGREDIGKKDIKISIVQNVNLKNSKVQEKIMKRANAVHSTFAEEHFNMNEHILESYKDYIDKPPLVITTIKQITNLLNSISAEFGLVGNLETDDGHSLAYQVSHLLPEMFEYQKQRVDMQSYDAPFNERDLPIMRFTNLKALKVHRVNSFIGNTSSNPLDVIFRVVRRKDPNWLNYCNLKAQADDYQRRNEARLNYIKEKDSLLVKAFEFLDVQDLPTVNRYLEAVALTYCEKAGKRGALKTELKVDDRQLMKKFFGSILANKTDPPSHHDDKVELPVQCIKALYSLIFLRSRKFKQRMLDILNAFRSIQKKLTFDMLDIGVRDQLTPEKDKPIPAPQNPSSKKMTNTVLPSVNDFKSEFSPQTVTQLGNREDLVEIIDNEICVKDTQGEYIFYSIANQDYENLVSELVKLGSYYIQKYETWGENQGEPHIDRNYLVNDLLEHELQFQESKLNVVLGYLEIYDHAINMQEQIKLAQIITDMMAMRPRLWLDANYFTQGYWSHIDALDKHDEALKAMTKSLIRADLLGKETLNMPSSSPDSTQLDSAGDTTNVNAYHIMPGLGKMVNLYSYMKACIEELVLIHDTDNNISINCLESAIWDYTLDIWKNAQAAKYPSLENGVIIENPSLAGSILHEYVRELNTTNPRLLPVLKTENFENPSDRLGVTVEEISELQLFCNLFGAFRLREHLLSYIDESAILISLYKSQYLNLKRETPPIEPADWNIGLRYISSVEDGAGNNTDLSLPAFELDSRLKAHMHFSSSEAFKCLMLSSGIADLKAVTQYQIMHTQLLSVAVMINQHAIDPYIRQLEELKLAVNYSYIPRNSKALWQNVLGRKGEGVVEEYIENEMKRLKAKMAHEASKLRMDISSKKLKHRAKLELSFRKISDRIQQALIHNSDLLAISIRNLRTRMVEGYCKEVLREVYFESIKLQIIKVIMEISKEYKIIPPADLKELLEEEEIKDGDHKLINDNADLWDMAKMPNINQILSMQSITELENRKWGEWEPYQYAETPDVLEKLKKQKFKPKPKNKNETVITSKWDWEFEGRLKSMLEVLVCKKWQIQVTLFINLLSDPVPDILEMQEKLRAGEVYWINHQNEDVVQTVPDRAVDRMLNSVDPRYTMKENIKRVLVANRVMSRYILELPSESRKKFLIQASLKSYRTLVATSYSAFHYCMINEIKDAPEHVAEFIKHLTRSLSRSYFPQGYSLSPLFFDPACPLIQLMERTNYINNNAENVFNIQAPTSNISGLEWGLMMIPSSERNYAQATSTSLIIKLDNYVASHQILKSTQPILASDTFMNYLDKELTVCRLKSALFSWKSGSAFLTDFKRYEQLVNEYRDQIEWKAEIQAAKDRQDREIGKLINELKLLGNEFHRGLCYFSINFLEKEIESFTSVLDKEDKGYVVREEFTCNIDMNYLDVTKKVAYLHTFLNTLRNRCTIVDSPTCGRALVFSIKDLSSLTKKFAQSLMKFAETQLRLRDESSRYAIAQLNEIITTKDREIVILKDQLAHTKNHVDRLVNSQLSQKGNQLIYDLDMSNRQLREIREYLGTLEKHLREEIHREYKEEVENKTYEIEKLKQDFKSYRDEMRIQLKSDVEVHKANAAREFRSLAISKKIRQKNEEEEEDHGKKHETDIVKMQDLIRKMRTYNQWNRLQLKQKYEKQVSELKEQLTSNQFLWEQLGESQRREALLKQELSFTQQSLSAAEKLADKLQTQIEDMNNQRLRLQQYKASKGRRLAELEGKVKEYKKLEHIDNSRLLSQLYQQHKRLVTLKSAEADAAQQYVHQHRNYQREINKLKRQLDIERRIKREAIEQLDNMRAELYGSNQDPSSIANVWRNRCEELVEEIKELKEENMSLKERVEAFGEEVEEEYIEQHSEILPKINQRNAPDPIFIRSK